MFQCNTTVICTSNYVRSHNSVNYGKNFSNKLQVLSSLLLLNLSYEDRKNFHKYMYVWMNVSFSGPLCIRFYISHVKHEKHFPLLY